MKRIIGLAISLFGGLAAYAGLEPDFYVDTLTSDGTGWIDPDYYYHAGSYPKTAKVQFDYYSYNYGRKVDDTTSSTAGLFGFWNTAKGGCSGARAYKTGELVFWHGGSSGKNSGIAGVPKAGRAMIEFDYIGKTAKWMSSTATKTGTEDLNLPVDTVTVPYHVCYLENSGASYLDVYSFRIYEQASDGGEVTLARNYRPACVNGRPALYDPITKTAAFPTTDGFTIPVTNEVSVAAGKTLHVTVHSATQRSVTLAAGSQLVFDGRVTLHPADGVILPPDGTVTVSMPVGTGAGTYVLAEGLDAGFSLATFALGALPAGLAGQLKKEGTKLVLTLSETMPHPEAIGSALSSDGHGYIDTAYLYKSTTLPRTARAEFLFRDTTRGKGAAPGPTTSNSARGVFGFWYGAQRSGARWYSSDCQRLGSGTENWSGSAGFISGEQTISIDYQDGTVAWGSSSSALGIATSDQSCRYYIFNLYNGAGPMDTISSSVFDFRGLKIYETADNFVTETLARDFVPCVDGGKPGIYDRVTGTVCHPTGDTNGFAVADVQWRVGMKGDVAYVPAGSSQTFATDGDGYLVLRRADGGVVVSGSGTEVSFTMPAAGVEIVATANKAVAASAVEQVEERAFVHDLTLGADAQLVFTTDGRFVLSGDLTLPAGGVVRLTLKDVTGPGAYPVLCGVPATVDLAKFSAGVTTSGYVVALERQGDALVLRVTDDPSGAPRFVTSVRSDGDGWIDSDCHYHGATYPKTAKVRFDFTNYNYGRKPNASSGFSAQFGFWSGSLFRSNGGDLTFWDGGVTAYSAFPKTGRMALEIDYRAKVASITKGGTTTVIKEGITVSAKDNASQTYYVCGCMGNNTPSYEDIHSFRIWTYDEQGNEFLAVDYVPCVSAGKAALYDKVRKIVTFPTYSDGAEGAGFTAEWGEVMQRFAHVTTVSAAPVCTPAFAPQDAFTFAADGSVTPERALTSLTFVSRDSDGVEINRSVVDGPVIGNAYAVSLGNAASVDVLVDETVETAEQDFGPAVVSCAGEALYRVVDRKRYELMLPADATVMFAAEMGAVTATYYDVSGAATGSRTLVDRIAAGTPLDVSLNGARFVILRVEQPKKGLILFVR